MSDTRGNVIIRLTDVDKSFDDERVVKKLNLDVEEGEFLTMLGPSGCGKTTTLRMIAGFEVPTSGQIFLEGEDVDDKKPNERNVNTVFQNYALFPHMNVFDNIAFGLVEKKVKKDEIRSRVEEMIKLVQLDGMEKRMPAQMSGGQKQRVAIARALVNRPKVLLLDEPLGALDLKLRKQMQGELKALQRRLGITFIYVTHDQEEALTMSDRIAVMNRGRLEQVGTPEEVYNHPETKFVADFIGESNIIEGYIENMTDDSIEVTMESGKAVIHETGYRMEEMVYLCIRPENLKISMEAKEGFRFRGQVKEHIFIGSTNKTMIEMPNGQMLKSVTPAEDELIPVGTAVNVFWNPGKAVVMRTKEEQIYNVIEQSVEIEGMTNDQIF
ncbi:ABC transporter ATP-binding protein [Lachnoclostridium sp. An138]|uniref:ABC transporter ATP-binding protein n=1 Tax=Lachnoclostridium sp. An138 TaxID=1965560 RepID=UPI000B3A315F|nr:ABC transporter ATP-binding protein [Lachnoclostridium sp. An138]OUQ16539.1 spermidine/putrescine ABC transporter ATP-binding protein [Lachnoclostridium sp. An138]